MIHNEIILALIPYADHMNDCEALGVMWHKGPCTCGFGELVEKLRAFGIDIVDGAIPVNDPQPPFAVDRPELADLIAKRNDYLQLEKSLNDEERRERWLSRHPSE
jgi:hypothetical protein